MQQRTPQGQTPLFLAAERGLVDNVAFLLRHGADPDSQDQVQDSPLVVGTRTSVRFPPSRRTSLIIRVFCSRSLRLQRPGGAAAPGGRQGQPGGLPRTPAAPRGFAAGQSRHGDPAAAGRCTPRPPEPLRPHPAGPGGPGGAPPGGGGSAEERLVLGLLQL